MTKHQYDEMPSFRADIETPKWFSERNAREARAPQRTRRREGAD